MNEDITELTDCRVFTCCVCGELFSDEEKISTFDGDFCDDCYYVPYTREDYLCDKYHEEKEESL